MGHDFVIRGGTIVAELDRQPCLGNTAAREGLIAPACTVDGEAMRGRQASGLLVMPGFLELHTHYGGQAVSHLVTSQSQEKVRWP